MNATQVQNHVKERPADVLIRKYYENPYHTAYGITKRAQRIGNEKVHMKECVYSALGIEKDKLGDNEVYYEKDQVKIGGQVYDIKVVFPIIFNEIAEREFLIRKDGYKNGSDINIESIDDLMKNGGHKVIKSIFGHGVYTHFSESQYVHILCDGDRAVANHYMVHPLRATHLFTGDISKFDVSYEQTKRGKILGFRHDNIESITKYRKNKVDEKIVPLILDKKTAKQYLKMLIKVNNQIISPPELFGENRFATKFKNPEEGEAMNNFLMALSNYKKIPYLKFADFLNQSAAMWIKSDNKFEREDWWVAPVVKDFDRLDNTETLKGTTDKMQRLCLTRNTDYARSRIQFLKDLEIDPDIVQMLWDNLDMILFRSLELSDDYAKLYQKLSKKPNGVENERVTEDKYSFEEASFDFKEINKALRITDKEFQSLKKKMR